MLQKRQYYQITGEEPAQRCDCLSDRASFKPGEVTAEKPNRIGYELALRFTKGRIPLLWRRTDRAHIHNHGIQFRIDGIRKFKDFWRSGLLETERSDLSEHGLSVIERKPYDERKSE